MIAEKITKEASRNFVNTKKSPSLVFVFGIEIVSEVPLFDKILLDFLSGAKVSFFAIEAELLKTKRLNLRKDFSLLIGGPTWDRTRHLLIMSQLL